MDVLKCRWDLKNRSRSPKSNQLFHSSQYCMYASLVKIHPLVQTITHGNHILYISKCHCDLEIRSRSPKSDQLFPSSKQCTYASLVKIDQLVQNAQKWKWTPTPRVSWSPPPPWKITKNTGFLSNTSPDPMGNHKTTKPAFNVWPPSARQRNLVQMAFRWGRWWPSHSCIWILSLTIKTSKLDPH